MKFPFFKKLSWAFVREVLLATLALPLRFFARKELYRSHYRSLISLKKLPLKRLDIMEVNAEIVRLLDGLNGCMIARFGSGEVEAMLRIERYQQMNRIEAAYEFIVCSGKELWCEENWNGLRLNAGFFSVDRRFLERFLYEMKEACQCVDVLGSWTRAESRYLNLLPEASVVTELSNLEPYFCQKPWSESLSGKKVLVIHPYAELIDHQYRQNRERLFPGSTCLPPFDLKCLKAVQTIAGNQDPRFNDWFEALSWMEDEAMKIDFDVALIGCGSYGFPLAARLKKSHKKVVHLGGALQILFGIKGARWDVRKEFSAMYNQYWLRPGPRERPQAFQAIEEGCYW